MLFARSKEGITMKNLRIMLFLALLSLIISVAFVSAQENENLAFSSEAAGVIVHTFESGVFAENEDGTFTLSLNAVPEIAALYFTSPSILARNYNVLELSDDWAYANTLSEEALFGSAHLQFGTTSVVLEITSPIYDADAETLSYTATFVEGVDDGTALKDAFAVPAAFDEASLFIELDPTFISTLISGREARASEIRGVISCLTCKP
jgi:hypothetical protein